MNKREPEMPRADGAGVLQHGEAAANESPFFIINIAKQH